MVKIFSLFMINLLTAIRYKMNFILSSLSLIVPVLPALLLLFNGNTEIFGFQSSFEYSAYLFLAATIWGGVEVLWSFVFQMRDQMREGILDETLMQPLTISQLIIGWTMEGIVTAILQSIPLIIISFLYLISYQSFSSILLCIILTLITYFSGYCMATILIAIMVNWKETDQLVSFIGNIAPFICGVIVPLHFIPFPLNYLGILFPFTWSLDILRYILFQSPLFLPLETELIIFILLTILYYVLGKKLFHLLYNYSRKKGGVIGY